MDSTLSITGGQVREGVAATKGGGLGISGSELTLSNLAIILNKALVSGGGLVVESSKLKCLSDVKISSNNASQGGGMWLSASSFLGNKFASLDLNRATDKGGGLYLYDAVTVYDTVVTNSMAMSGGGAYLSVADVVLGGVIFDSCSASDSGGALTLVSSKLVTSGLVITKGSATKGAGVYASVSRISGQTRIESCTATQSGGGMYLTDGAFLSGIEISDCHAKYGGGITAYYTTLEVKDLSVSSSTAVIGGGGMYASNCTITMQDAVFASLSSENMGGGMMLEATSVQHNNVTVKDSEATDGGGAYLVDSSLVPLSASDTGLLSQVTGNEATNSGGNVFSSLKVALQQLNISNAKANTGGGVFFYTATGNVSNCLITHNWASSQGGGVHMNAYSSVLFRNVDISGNSANTSGGGVLIQDSQLTHSNLNISDNGAPNGGGIFASGIVSLHEDDPSAADIVLCSMSDNWIYNDDGLGAAIYMDAGCEMDATALAVRGGTATYGGGIYIAGGTLRLADSSVFKNVAINDGGGIYLAPNSNLELSFCEIYQNYASQTGGGIMSSGMPKGSALNHVRVDNSYLYLNRAVYYGGGIAISRTNLDGQGNEMTANVVRNVSGGAFAALTEGNVTMINWDFFNNTIGDGDAVKGGTLSFDGGVTAVIVNANILSNPTAQLVPSGGLIYVKSPTTSMEIFDSTLSDGQSYSGGLIYSVDAKVSIDNCSLLNGWANEFGGSIFAQNTRLTIRNSQMANNFAYYDGGGIFMTTSGSLVLENVNVQGNVCQAGGGAMHIAKGANIKCTFSDTRFSDNVNFGLGSAIFIGRRNTLVLKRCTFFNNGNLENDGGALYAIDAVVSIDDSVFDSNHANKGAAIELSRNAKLTMNNSVLRNNTADVWGGAIYTSVRATAQLNNTLFDRNSATEGGGVYSIGSSSVTFLKVELRGNDALNFGGGVSMRGGSHLSIDQSLFTQNHGYTGGAISIAEYALLTLTNSKFVGNRATDFGGAIYVNTNTRGSDNLIQCAGSNFGENKAVAGADLYWVYSPSFSFFECADSSSFSSTTGTISASTSATQISTGWWPPVVTSGVSLGVSTYVNESLPPTPESTALQQLAANRDLTRPNDTTLWPTVVLRDFYGAIASHDNSSRCFAKRTDTQGYNSNESFFFSPSNDIDGWVGYVTFGGATIFSGSRAEPYTVGVTCKLPRNVVRSVAVDIVVDRCKTGYQNVDG